MKVIFLVISIWLSFIGLAIKSPFTKYEVNSDSTNNYSFLVSGHFYGNQSNQTQMPCNTILGNIDWLNEQKPTALFCLGDLFGNVETDIPNYDLFLFSRLKFPLFNAVGNHDLKNEIYQNNFGDTYFYFELNGDVHIVLDTEIDNGNIEGDQMDMLKEAVKIGEQKQINNVFIYAHRTLWSKHYSELDKLFKDNTQSVMGNNFKSDVLPLLEGANAKNIYWFSGSIGGEAPASFFYFPKGKITYIGTAVRGLKRDAVLKVMVNNGQVNFETHSLTNQPVEKLEYYSVDYWNQGHEEDGFNYRLIPLYVKQTFLSRYFWYGFFFFLFISLGIKFFKNRKK
ncbi:MAG: metallophosphoesterase family protein [Putridiphycobacter sp.]